MEKNVNRAALLNALKNEKPARSQWARGVQAAALDLVESVDELDTVSTDRRELENQLLNGASSWSQYSWGGCNLCYNIDIAERYMTPSELKRYMAPGHDASEAFGGEQLLDMQARALHQAFTHAYRAALRLA